MAEFLLHPEINCGVVCADYHEIRNCCAASHADLCPILAHIGQEIWK